MEYKKVYVAGGAGMLGSYLIDSFESIGSSVFVTDIDTDPTHTIGGKIQYGDVRSYNQMESQILDFNADLVINLAAMTDLEESELDSDRCYSTNTIGAINLQVISKKMNVPYIFISTAGVFDGEKEYYTDVDKPNPLGVYARSKVYAEDYLMSNYEKTWIFRAGWMMGGGKKKDKKFVSKILNQIESGAKTIRVVDDKLGTPTYTKDFANSLMRHSVEGLPFDIYNMVSKGDASRYDVALEIVNYFKYDVEVIKVDSSVFSESYFAPRPASEKLINYKLESIGKNYMNNWKDMLNEYLSEYYTRDV